MIAAVAMLTKDAAHGETLFFVILTSRVDLRERPRIRVIVSFPAQLLQDILRARLSDSRSDTLNGSTPAMFALGWSHRCLSATRHAYNQKSMCYRDRCVVCHKIEISGVVLLVPTFSQRPPRWEECVERSAPKFNLIPRYA